VSYAERVVVAVSQLAVFAKEFGEFNIWAFGRVGHRIPRAVLMGFNANAFLDKLSARPVAGFIVSV